MRSVRLDRITPIHRTGFCDDDTEARRELTQDDCAAISTRSVLMPPATYAFRRLVRKHGTPFAG